MSGIPIPTSALVFLGIVGGTYLLVVVWVVVQVTIVGRTWQNVHLDIDLLDEGVAAASADAARIFPLAAVLQDLGFNELGLVQIRRAAFDTLVWVGLADDATVVAEVVVHAMRRGSIRVPPMVEFISQFENGASLSTVCSLALLESSPNSQHRIVWCQEARDPALLLRLHGAATQVQNSRQKRYDLTPLTLLPWFRREATKEIKDYIAQGNCDVRQDREQSRIRWGRLVALIARELPPASTVRRFAARRATRELLRSAGISREELRKSSKWKPPVANSSVS